MAIDPFVLSLSKDSLIRLWFDRLTTNGEEIRLWFDRLTTNGGGPQ